MFKLKLPRKRRQADRDVINPPLKRKDATYAAMKPDKQSTAILQCQTVGGGGSHRNHRVDDEYKAIAMPTDSVQQRPKTL